MTTANDLFNANGTKWLQRGTERRAHRTTVTLKGVEIEVEYLLDGTYLPATDIDDACYPTVTVKQMWIGSDDVTRLFGDSHLREEVIIAVEEWVRS